MSNKQIWVTIVLSFVLLFTLVAGGACYGVVKSVESVLSAPAATSEFEIEGEFTIYNKLNGANLTVNEIRGKVNSKVLDLILLAVNN